MKTGCSFRSSDGQTPVVFSRICGHGSSGLLLMVHSVSDAVNSQWMVEEETSCSVQMLSSFFNTYGAVNAENTDWRFLLGPWQRFSSTFHSTSPIWAKKSTTGKVCDWHNTCIFSRIWARQLTLDHTQTSYNIIQHIVLIFNMLELTLVNEHALNNQTMSKIRLKCCWKG